MLTNNKKNSRYKFVDDKIMAIDPITNEFKNTLGIRLIENVNIKESYVHFVGSNENIFDIALKYYGDARLWWRIADANRIVITDPYDLSNISELLIPNDGGVRL